MPGSAVIPRNKKVADAFRFDPSATPKVPQPSHPIQQRLSCQDLTAAASRPPADGAASNRRHSMYEYDAVVSATINLSEFETPSKEAAVASVGTTKPEVKVTSAPAKDNDYDEVEFSGENMGREVETLAVSKPPPRSSSSGSSRESDNIGRSIARKCFPQCSKCRGHLFFREYSSS